MKKLLLLLVIGCAPQEQTITVPALHGPDITLPIKDIHKIRPLGWAMMLERGENEDLFYKTSKENQEETYRLLELYWRMKRYEK